MLFSKLKSGWASLGVSFLVGCAITTAAAAPLSWQLHIPEATDEAMSQSSVPAQQSLEISEAHWRSAVVSHLLAKNLTGAQQTLHEAPTQGVPVSLLTSRAAWLLGLGLVPWAEATLESASRQSIELDTTQQKALQHLKASFGSVYATEQSPMAVLRDCAKVLPSLMAAKPNDKAYQQWQVLEGPERLSSAVQTQRQELAVLGAPFEEAPLYARNSEGPLFPASLKPSLLDTIKTLQASQRVLNNAAGVVDIGLHQRRLTPTEYNQQCAELIGFLTQQQQRVAQYRGRLQRRLASVSANNAQLIVWKNALNESVALVTLHEAALAALRESIEAPFVGKLASPSPPSSASTIAKELPLLEASVTQRLQGALNGWDSLSVAQAMLELGLPLSFSKALALESSRAVRMLTKPLPAASPAGKKEKSTEASEAKTEPPAAETPAPKTKVK